MTGGLEKYVGKKIDIWATTHLYMHKVTKKTDSAHSNVFLPREIKNVKMIPDGNAEFTEGVGFSTTFKNRGFGQRSWRYSAVIIDGIIEKEFVEPGLVEDSDPDPFEVSDAETMLAYLKENK